jgi:hypothetical protein
MWGNPQSQQVRTDLGVGDAVLRVLNLVDRALLFAGDREDTRQGVGILWGHDEQPDVVQQAGRERLRACSGFGRERGRESGDAGAVAVQVVEVEPGDRRVDLKFLERGGVQREGS